MKLNTVDHVRFNKCLVLTKLDSAKQDQILLSGWGGMFCVSGSGRAIWDSYLFLYSL
uniref:Uncharacterized protein n=1 Tax=Setaria italica TaxID=4555 RepID=K4A4G6_SETIT